MSTATFTADERMALLLSILGDDIANVAFQSMNPTRANYVRKLLNEFKSDPPTDEELEYVIGDFNQYFQFAMQTLKPELAAAAVSKKSEAKPKETGSQTTVTYFEKVAATADPVTDLNRLNEFQISSVIKGDHPKTIALVLRNIDVKHAARVLELLPDSVRSESVIFLTRESTVPAPIVAQVLKTTVQKAIAVEFREEVVDQSQILAELMRSLPKDMRVKLLADLEAADPDLIAAIKSKLYLLEDVLRLEDRDTQKLLGEIESDSLIISLQRCDPAIVDKLLGNLSKRARESIAEEMEYKKSVSDEEIEESRQQLVAALARLDEAGEIKLK